MIDPREQLRTMLAAGVLLALAAGLSQAVSGEPDAEASQPLHAFAVDVTPASIDGFVDVREGAPGGPGAGTRLPLQQLGLGHAEILAFHVDTRLGSRWDLQGRLRYFMLRGSASFGQEVGFNGVSYAAGTTIDAAPLLFDLRVDLRRPVLTFGRDGRLDAIAGLDFTYLSFRTSGSAAASSIGSDKNEDFYRQEIPIPSLGLRVEQPLSRSIRFYAEGFGFQVLGANSLRNEGGVVRLWQRQSEAQAGLDWRLSPSRTLQVGYRAGSLRMNEVSPEDGNQILLRDKGPFLSLTFRF
jgi:hypothetical protein